MSRPGAVRELRLLRLAGAACLLVVLSLAGGGAARAGGAPAALWYNASFEYSGYADIEARPVTPRLGEADVAQGARRVKWSAVQPRAVRVSTSRGRINFVGGRVEGFLTTDTSIDALEFRRDGRVACRLVTHGLVRGRPTFAGPGLGYSSYGFSGGVLPPTGKPVKLTLEGVTCDPCIQPAESRPLIRPPTAQDPSCAYGDRKLDTVAVMDPVYTPELRRKLDRGRVCRVDGRLGAGAITITCTARVLRWRRRITRFGRTTNVTETGEEELEAALAICPQGGTVRC